MIIRNQYYQIKLVKELGNRQIKQRYDTTTYVPETRYFNLTGTIQQISSFNNGIANREKSMFEIETSKEK